MNRQYVVLLATCFALGACLADETDEREAEAISIGQAFAANWEQLRQYDLLMTVEQFEVTPSGGTEEQLDTYRMISDHEHERFFFASVSENEKADNGESTPVKSRHIQGFFFDPNQFSSAWKHDGDVQPYQFRHKDHQQALGRSGFPDVRRIGILATPASFGSEHDLQQSFQVFFHPGKEIWEQKRDCDSCELVVQVKHGDHGLVSRTYLDFDTRTYLPSRLTQTMENSETVSKRVTELIKWQEIKGLHVPESVHAERKRVRGSRQTTLINWMAAYDIKLHWLSINEPVLQDEASGAQVLSLLATKKLLEMTSPDLSKELVGK